MKNQSVKEVVRTSYLLAIVHSAYNREVDINVESGAGVILLLTWVYDVVMRRRVGWRWVFYHGSVYSQDIEDDWFNACRNGLMLLEGGKLVVTTKGVLVMNLWLDIGRIADVNRCVDALAPFIKKHGSEMSLLAVSLLSRYWYSRSMKHALAWYIRDFKDVDSRLLKEGAMCAGELLEIICKRLIGATKKH